MIVASVIGFAGWTEVAGADLFSATRAVIAILGTDL